MKAVALALTLSGALLSAGCAELDIAKAVGAALILADVVDRSLRTSNDITDMVVERQRAARAGRETLEKATRER